MNDPLQPAFVAASPRLSPPATPLRSWLIHGGVLVLWGLLFAMAFRVGNVGAWSVGVAYVLYDTVLLLFVGWMTLPILRPRPRPAETPATRRNTLGVIVASHNEAAVLPVTLAALLGQSDVPDRIVIADDGSSDGTAELLTTRYGLVAPALGELSAASATHPSLYWLRLPHGGKAVALNAAILCIDTDTVLTVDGDTLLDSQAIGAVRRAFTDEPNLVAATGVITPVCSRTLAGRCFQWFQTYEYIRNFLSRYAWMRVNGLLLISGAFAGFRTDAVRAVGGFDTDCWWKTTNSSTACTATPRRTGCRGPCACWAMRKRTPTRPAAPAPSCASAAAGSAASCRRSTGTARWSATGATAGSAWRCCR